MNPYLDRCKHIIKVLIGHPDPHWKARAFEYGISRQTIRRHDEIAAWAERMTYAPLNHYSPSSYEQGIRLREIVLKKFKDSCASFNLCIAIHVPDQNVSPAGYSLFNNLAASLQFIGIRAPILGWGQATEQFLKRESPDVLLTSDSSAYLNMIDWPAVQAYRAHHPLLVGLTASLEEYGNTPLPGRLTWAKAQGVDFYYSFREQAYIQAKKQYQLFFDAGYRIFSIPFGANPLIHYPVAVPGIRRDLDFVFIASNQAKHKGERYHDYLGPIVSKYAGFIDGPGWRHAPHFRFNLNRDRYVYARAKAGLNIHLPEQILAANETNERTYHLAACGVPVLSDHAKVLDTLFPTNSLFIADSPAEYLAHFKTILHDPAEATRRALLAQKTVFEKYTTFHRAANFVTELHEQFRPMQR
jgi:hypothetical protein